MEPGDRGDGAGWSKAPRLSRPVLLRDRLIERLLARWSVPLTVITAGAGFGKTTLLAQALAENELDPHGVDCWLTCRPHDNVAATFASGILRSLGAPPLHGGAVAEGARRIAETVHAQAPTHVCLVFDDVHVLDPAGAGARLLAELVDELPANGHLVLAGRADPPVPLARRRVAGIVNDLAESELTFTEDEVRAFAAMRVATPGSIAAAGGWPALAELLATTNRAVAVAYLWDEVLGSYDDDRRCALAMLHALGGGDGELLSAALGRPVDVWEMTRSMPLATVTEQGWASMHDLWAPALGRVLTAEQRREGALRAACLARSRGAYTQAIHLYGAAGAYDDVLCLVRVVCSDSHPLVPTEVMNDWAGCLADGGLADTAEMALLLGTVRKPTDPLASIPFFELAARRFAARGEVDGEVAATFHLGHIAWWHEDFDLLARLFDRCVVLADAGSALAASIMTLGPLVMGEILGDVDAVITAARTASRDHQHPEILPLTDYLEARAHLVAGDPRAALVAAMRACNAATPTMRPPAEFERLAALWALGRSEDVLAHVDAAIAELEEVGWIHNRAANSAQAALWLCLSGRAGPARTMLERANQVGDSAGSWARALVALARAMLLVDRDDEPGAVETMCAELVARPLDDPAVARAHAAWVPLSYVLTPAARAHWDAATLRGTAEAGRSAARAVVALRERDLLVPSELVGVDLVAVRAQLPVPWLADVALTLAANDRLADAEQLLSGATHPLLRGRLRTLAKHPDKRSATAASALLASRAMSPEHRLRARVLGPLELEFDGAARWPAQFNRRAVRDLFLLLVEKGSLARARLVALLWPDLGEDAGRNNLRVTLTYLTQALQPHRQANEPSHYVEDVGDDIRMRPGAALEIDVVEFHAALGRASDYEVRGAVTLALHEYRRAVDLYRGEYLASVGDAEWAYAPRERERLAFVRAAVRAGELALANGELDVASDLALRAIDADGWSEAARRLLAEACLARGDRSGALRVLDDCARMLSGLGVGPEPVTRMLARRVGYTPAFPNW
jgi:LuxR family maltose regulon positive regulatory protein